MESDGGGGGEIKEFSISCIQAHAFHALYWLSLFYFYFWFLSDPGCYANFAKHCNPIEFEYKLLVFQHTPIVCLRFFHLHSLFATINSIKLITRQTMNERTKAEKNFCNWMRHFFVVISQFYWKRNPRILCHIFSAFFQLRGPWRLTNCFVN